MYIYTCMCSLISLSSTKYVLCGVFFSSIYRCKIENILMINSRLNTSYMFWHTTTDMIIKLLKLIIVQFSISTF